MTGAINQAPEEIDVTPQNGTTTHYGQAPAHGAPKKPKKGRGLLIALLVIVIIACLVGAGFGISQMIDVQKQIETARNEESIIPVTPDDVASSEAASASAEAQAKPLQKNPINFEALKQQNPDIYAWIYVPNTNVNHAILQRPGDNEFYLGHDEDGEASELGAVYTEDFNTTDWQDGVTLVYGHNIKDGLMFSTLHYFEDPQFFADNDKFYIYAPGHIYTYRIVSAFTTDDRHVLYRYGYFQTYDQLREFEQEVLDPHSIQQNTREVALDDSSKLVVLSTCNTGALEENGRYLVCGVMIDDSPTE